MNVVNSFARNIVVGALMAFAGSAARAQPALPPGRSPASNPTTAPASAPAAAPAAPLVSFMGAKAPAASVVFCCDASGSMMAGFDPLRVVLRKTIDRLTPAQRFNVVFSRDVEAIAIGDGKDLFAAEPANKRRAYDFFEQTSPRGSCDPIPGLRRAFALHPEVIFFLTNGDFPDNEQVIAEVRKLNSEKKVKVYTVAYIERGESYEKMLKAIATDNGGSLQIVSDENMETYLQDDR